MGNVSSLSSAIKLGIIYIIIASRPALAQSLDDTFYPWKFLILGQVEAMDRTQPDPDPQGTRHYSYHVRVISEYQNAIKPDSDILIEGIRSDGGFVPDAVPYMTKGVYFVMPIFPTQNPQKFSFYLGGGDLWCPVGINLPTAISDKDVPDVKMALLQYGNSISHPLRSTQIMALRKNDNYYLWALSTALLAKNDPKNEAYWLANELANATNAPCVDDPATRPILTLRQATWIVHCLMNVIPSEFKPSPDAVLVDLQKYLVRYEAVDRDRFSYAVP